MRQTLVFSFLIAGFSACAVPVPVPAPAPTRAPAPRSTPAAAAYPQMEWKILGLVNAERKSRGLKPLVPNARLDQAAKLHATNMAAFRKMSHVLPESRFPTLSHRAQYVAYPYAMIAENIALGFTDAESVVRGWMESPGHRRNILSPEAVEIGIGVVSSKSGGLYFCQVFGRQLTSI
jgi:uncharacterized protein YkwD